MNHHTACVVCGGPHGLDQCGRFRGFTAEKRLRVVQVAKCCLSCMAPTHLMKDCWWTCWCRRCGEDHHTLLHQQRYRPQSPSPGPWRPPTKPLQPVLTPPRRHHHRRPATKRQQPSTSPPRPARGRSCRRARTPTRQPVRPLSRDQRPESRLPSIRRLKSPSPRQPRANRSQPPTARSSRSRNHAVPPRGHHSRRRRIRFTPSPRRGPNDVLSPPLSRDRYRPTEAERAVIREAVQEVQDYLRSRKCKTERTRLFTAWSDGE